jgi:hypothetical protein
VPAGALRLGERLSAEDGSTPVVLSLKKLAAPEPVFNIEVDGDHVYRVGEQGLLVHNASLFGNYTKHNSDKSNRAAINTCNVIEYFKTDGDGEPTIQIGAGPKAAHVAGALPEDIMYWNGDTLLWVEMGEPLSPYLKDLKGQLFSGAFVINALNSGGKKAQEGP